MNIARPRSELGSSGLRDMPTGMLKEDGLLPNIAPKARGSLRRKTAGWSRSEEACGARQQGWSRFRGERALLPRPTARQALGSV